MMETLRALKKEIEKEVDRLQKEQAGLLEVRERIIQLEKVQEAKRSRAKVKIEFSICGDIGGSVVSDHKRLYKDYKNAARAYGAAYISLIGGGEQ
jgi:hypothetical protein